MERQAELLATLETHRRLGDRENPLEGLMDTVWA